MNKTVRLGIIAGLVLTVSFSCKKANPQSKTSPSVKQTDAAQVPAEAPRKQEVSQPPEGQLLRDAQGALAEQTAKLRNMGMSGPSNYRVAEVARDPYEKDRCVATVHYDFGSLTGIVVLSYRWTGEFWTCVSAQDAGLK